MATYTSQLSQGGDWSDDATWAGGLVPNDLSANVAISQQGPVSVGSTESFSIESLAIASHLSILGSLSVAGAVSIQQGGVLSVFGGTLTAASIVNDGYYIESSGQITTSGVLTNDNEIIGSGLTLNLGGLDNTKGSLIAWPGGLTVHAPTGFVNLSGATLTGGAYSAGEPASTTPEVLALDIGAEIASDAANISLLGGGVIESYDAASKQFVSIASTMNSIAATGTLSLQSATESWVPLMVEGQLSLSASTLDDSLLTVDGTVSLSASTLNGGQITVDAGGEVEGSGTITGSVANSGTIVPNGLSAGNSNSVLAVGVLDIAGTIAGSGQLEVGPISLGERDAADNPPTAAVAELELGGAASDNVTFADATGTLQLDDPSGFTGTITTSSATPDGFFWTNNDGYQYPVQALGDLLVLKGISLSAVTSWNYVDKGGAGVLTLVAGGVTYAYDIVGNFSQASFKLSAGAAIGSAPTLDIKMTPPAAVTSLTSSSSTGGAVGKGQQIYFTLDATNQLIGTNAALTLSNGGVATADFNASLPNTQRTFTYTVAATDASTSDLKVTGYTGTIADSTGQALNPAQVVEDTGFAVSVTPDAALPPAPEISDPHLPATYSSTPSIDGTGVAGDVVTAYIDGQSAGTATVAMNGDWTITPTSTFANGSHTVTATQTNNFGTSAASSPGGFSIGGATADGDVHMMTYDGLKYDFQADGDYVLTRATAPGDNFQVQIETSPNLSDAATSFTTLLAAQLGADVLTVGINRSVPVWIDGMPDTSLNPANPVQTLAGGSLVEVSPTEFKLISAFGESLTVDDLGPYLDTDVQLSAAQGPGSMQGLLGSDSGQAYDFQLPDGSLLPTPITDTAVLDQFAPAWSVTSADSLFDRQMTADAHGQVAASLGLKPVN